MKLQPILLVLALLVIQTVVAETEQPHPANTPENHPTDPASHPPANNESATHQPTEQKPNPATTTTLSSPEATHNQTTAHPAPTTQTHPASIETQPDTSHQNIEILDEAQHELEPSTEPLLEHDQLSQQLLQNIGILSKQEKEQEFKIQEAEREFEKQEEKKQQEELESWLEQERKQTEEATKEDTSGGQSFQFSLSPGGFMSLYYDASNNKPGNDIHLDVWVYIEQNNSFYIPNRPVEYSGVSLAIVNPNSKILLQKKIYISRSFEFRPPRNSGYYFNYMNNYASTVLIVTNAERLNKTVDQLNSTHLDPLSSSLKGVFDKMESSFNDELKYSYKSEIGFREREDQHQSTMLMLTGIELITIILTAVIQMYCLRNLLDNRSIV